MSVIESITATWIFWLVVLACAGGFAAYALRPDPARFVAYLRETSRHRKFLPPAADVPKIAVIGAGFSGLALCAALRRHGIAFECFEGADEIGGNWYNGVYENVYIISSKMTTELKDFHMPSSFPDFPSRAQMHAYLMSYTEHFGLRPFIRFNTRVTGVAPAATAAAPGVEYALTMSDGTTRSFGGVIVANGHHWDKRWGGPWSGAETYTGRVVHSKDYKSPKELEGQRVLVVGGGNSACDIAAEAARFASCAHISMRRGYWFLPRIAFGRPLIEIIRPWMPIWVQRGFLRAYLRLVVGRYEQYGLMAPDHAIWDRHPTINSELLELLRKGAIAPHPDIARFRGGKTVEFVDGKVADFDVIVHATGFHTSIPLLDPALVRWSAPGAGRGGHEGGDRSYPDLLEGFAPRQWPNFFVAGVGQVRYGVGPFVTALAETIACSLRVQTRLRSPVGRYLYLLGARPLTSYLMDPIAMFTKAMLMLRVLPWLPVVDRWMGAPAARATTKA